MCTRLKSTNLKCKNISVKFRFYSCLPVKLQNKHIFKFRVSYTEPFLRKLRKEKLNTTIHNNITQGQDYRAVTTHCQKNKSIIKLIVFKYFLKQRHTFSCTTFYRYIPISFLFRSSFLLTSS